MLTWTWDQPGPVPLDPGQPPLSFLHLSQGSCSRILILRSLHPLPSFNGYNFTIGCQAAQPKPSCIGPLQLHLLSVRCHQSPPPQLPADPKGTLYFFSFCMASGSLLLWSPPVTSTYPICLETFLRLPGSPSTSLTCKRGYEPLF